MQSSAGSGICPSWQKRSRTLIAAAIAGIFFAVSILCAGGCSTAFAQKPESKSASDKKGAKSAKAKGGKRRGPAKVIVDKVTEGPAVDTVQIYGRIIAQQTGVIAARARGAIGTVEARVGDRVRKGDVLATLVADMLTSERDLKKAELKEFSAKIRTAGSQLALAAQELERLERLRKSSAFSVARYQDKLRQVERTKSALAEARARSDQARAELRMSDINLHNAKIRAPYAGVISARHVEVGNYVSVGARVVTILNDESLELEAEVPANRLGGLTSDAKIRVVPEYGKPYRAKVRAIVPEENALSRTRVVRFTPIFTERDATVAANQSVVIHIPSGASKNAVTVHKDAITQRRGKRVVFLVQKDDDSTKVKMRPVELGEAFGLRFEVLKGLKPGDQVVIRGNERLRSNQKIRIQSAGSDRKGRREKGKRRGGKRGANGKRGGS